MAVVRREATTAGALSGLRVIETASELPAAVCSRLLCGLGAEVITISLPSWQRQPRSPRAAVSAFVDAGKKSVTLDLTSAKARPHLRLLLHSADILVEDMSATLRGTADDPFASLGHELDRLIWTTITPFGLTGSYKGLKATELTIAAQAGWAFQTGEPGREPLRPGTFLLQSCAPGVTAALATVSAIFARAHSGKGQRIDISCMETLIAISRFHETTLSYTGIMPRRIGNKVSNTYPYTVYPCRDGYFAALTLTEAQWESLCQMIGRPELLADPRFRSNRERFHHADELDSYLMPWFRERTTQECLDTGQLWRLPFVIVCDVGQVKDLPQHAARGFLRVLPRRAGRPIVVPYAPFQMSVTPWVSDAPAPRRGKDNAAIYGGLGIGPKERRTLLREGVT